MENEDNKQKILMEIVYNGIEYHGLAYQGEKTETISGKITDALISTKLIPNREFAEIQFIGRTDKGVSAIKNCCSVFVRKSIYKKKGGAVKEKLPYCRIINSKLPRNVRAVKYAIVDDGFSCLGRCVKRGYKYYILHDTKQSNNERAVCDDCAVDFNLEKVEEGLEIIKGEHDFRNLCKVNFENCKTYNRVIYRAEIKEVMGFSNELGKFTVYELYLEANGFLWHLVRNIAGVLMKIGNNRESPDAIDFLLDVDKCKIKPNYEMGSPFPLLLCNYEFKNEEEIRWEVECDNYMLYQINQNREEMKNSFCNFIVWANIENTIANRSIIESTNIGSRKCCKVIKPIKECVNSKEQTYDEKYSEYLKSKGK